MSNTTFTCAQCGAVHPVSQRHMVQGDALCETCFNMEAFLCSRCGTPVYCDNNAGDTSTPLCEDCFHHYDYTFCERCGVLLRSGEACYGEGDDDEPYCASCHSRYRSSIIHDYYYKPDPIFYGKGPRYFGIELEIDGAGERNDYAAAILAESNCPTSGNSLLYAKHDGSLSNGFELVSPPMSYAYHCKEMPWAAVLAKAKSLGYTSHNARTCGLHIHVSRNALGISEEQQDACIARILFLMESFWNELLCFSRRTPSQMARWASRYGYKDQPQEILEHAKKGYSGRYTCVNLQNHATIEFRIFRGTLKLNTFIATLQMVNHICDVALCLSDEHIKSLSWPTFVSGIQSNVYPELVQYLKERRLYVNDIIPHREEEI